MNMLGPFLLLWVLTVLPIAFIPQWIHPKLRTRQERRAYKCFAAATMIFTWLAITAVDTWVSDSASLLIWLATVGFFVGLIVHSIRQRIRVKKLNQLSDQPTFDDIDRAFVTELRKGI